MAQRNFRRYLTLGLAFSAVIILPGAYLFFTQDRSPGEDAVRTLERYVRAVYARDYKRAYSLISSEDRRLKKQDVYVRERGAFSGFTLEAARKLSSFIEARPVQTRLDDTRARIKLELKLPDAKSLSALLLEWDEDRLNSLPATEHRKILTSIDRLSRSGKIPMIEGEEEFLLFREARGWRVFLNWAAGVRIAFGAVVPTTGILEVTPVPKETVVQRGELFTIAYRVKNRSEQNYYGRISHHVEPQTLAQYLDLVECALLLPVRLRPGKEEEYWSTYLVRGDLPEGTENLKVTYEFKVEP